jgi:hypothetical protein
MEPSEQRFDDLPASTQAPGRARAWARPHLTTVREPAASHCLLVLSELVTLAAGRAERVAVKPLTVGLQVGHDAVLLRVTDSATDEPVAARCRRLSSSLQVVDGIAAAWGVNRDGARSLWAAVACGGPGP